MAVRLCVTYEQMKGLKTLLGTKVKFCYVESAGESFKMIGLAEGWEAVPEYVAENGIKPATFDTDFPSAFIISDYNI